MSSTPMTSQDALWLTMDRPNNLMVIDTVMWLRSVPDWDAVAEVVQDRLINQFAVFRSHAVANGSDWEWQELDDFSLADQFNHVTLPNPGGMAELREFVAAQRSEPFSFARPMWTMHFIENLTIEEGVHGAAIMARFHHSIADGIRLTQAVMGLCDLDPADVTAVGRPFAESVSPLKAVATVATEALSDVVDIGASASRHASDAIKGARDVVTTAAKGDLGTAAATVVEDGKSIFTTGTAALKFPERLMDVSTLVSSPGNRIVNDSTIPGKFLLSGSSVQTVWSGPPSVEKDADWAPVLDLDDVKAIGRATGTTVNDVLISSLAVALSRYLRERGDTTTDELIWMVPVSIQGVQPGVPKDLGNHFALVALRMPIGIEDYRACLTEIHARMERIKSSDEAFVTFGLQRGIAQAPSQLAAGLTNYFANKAVGVLTNVPGPRTEMRIAGTAVEGVLGWAPCSGDQPLTICIFSYNGKVSVGFGADKALIPDLDRLSELFAEGFRDMFAAIVESS